MGGHFESSNMAAPMKICFGFRQIWIEHIKKYQCTKFHNFRPICTIAPLTDRTILQLFFAVLCANVQAICTGIWAVLVGADLSFSVMQLGPTWLC